MVENYFPIKPPFEPLAQNACSAWSAGSLPKPRVSIGLLGTIVLIGRYFGWDQIHTEENYS